VQSGASSIYSLRDAKGQPHVTIETVPTKAKNDPIDWFYNADELPTETFARIDSEARQRTKASGRDMLKQTITESPEFQAFLQKPPSIQQIKGKNNQAPSPEHLPFIQDFIRSGQWSGIGDLKNAGMHKVGDKYLTMDELKATLARRTPEGSPILDQQGVDATDAMQRWIEDQDLNRI
jgi:hypothetical protein